MRVPTPREDLINRTAFSEDIGFLTPSALLADYLPYHYMRQAPSADPSLVDAWALWMEDGHEPFFPEVREDARQIPLALELASILGRAITLKESRALLRAAAAYGDPFDIEGISAEELAEIVQRHAAAYAEASALIIPGSGKNAALGRTALEFRGEHYDVWSLFRPHPRLNMDDPDDTLFAWCVCIVPASDIANYEPADVIAVATGMSFDTSKDLEQLARFRKRETDDIGQVLEELDDKGWPALKAATGIDAEAFKNEAGKAFVLMVDRLWINPGHRGQGFLPVLLREMRAVMVAGYDRVDLDGIHVHLTAEDASAEAQEIVGEARLFGFRLPAVYMPEDDQEPWDEADNEALEQWVPALRRHIAEAAHQAEVPAIYWPDTGE